MNIGELDVTDFIVENVGVDKKTGNNIIRVYSWPLLMFELSLKLRFSLSFFLKNSVMYDLQYIDLYFDPRLDCVEVIVTNLLNDLMVELRDKERETGEDIENRDLGEFNEE
jgi:hypothetical protein